jgi:hypothetical protein
VNGGTIGLAALTVLFFGILAGVFAAFSRTKPAHVDVVGDHVRITMQGLLPLSSCARRSSGTRA